MKRILLAAVIAIFAINGCAPKEDKAAAVASDFLTDFFGMNYEGAAALCSDDIANMLRDTVAADEYPSEVIRAKVIEASKQTTFTILCSETEEESGAVVVSYEVHPYGAVGNTAIPHTMRLEKVDGSWKIVALE